MAKVCGTVCHTQSLQGTSKQATVMLYVGLILMAKAIPAGSMQGCCLCAPETFAWLHMVSAMHCTASLQYMLWLYTQQHQLRSLYVVGSWPYTALMHDVHSWAAPMPVCLVLRFANVSLGNLALGLVPATTDEHPACLDMSAAMEALLCIMWPSQQLTCQRQLT